MKCLHGIMLNLILCVPLFLIGTPLLGQKEYQGLLWEISGNGLENPSYLYGTMHVSNKVAFYLGEPFFEALGSVDQVALELEPELWFDEILGGSVLTSLLRLGQQNGMIYGYGNNNEYEGRMKLPDNTNLTVQAYFRASPQMINQLMFRLHDPSGNFEEETWLDMYIYQSAKKLGKNTLGLETFDESMDMLLKAQKEMADDPESAMGLDMDMADRIKAQADLENAYRKGDLDMLDSLSTKLNPAPYTKYILIERNKNFVVGMDTLMQQAPLFTGVGAAHLPGEEGCIEMLRALGYQLSPVKMGKRDGKRKDKLSESILKRELKTFKSEDGRISFETPAKAYELSMSGKDNGYICMDIPNGMTFILDRGVTNNSLKGKSPEYLLASLDSMLFEVVPGDIIEKKKIEKNGHPGFDILHRVSKGDINRSMVIFTPQEVVVARLSATGDKIKKGAGDHFFSTLELDLDKDRDQEWRKISSPDKSYSLEFPGAITDMTKIKANSINGDQFIQSVDKDGDAFLFHRLELTGIEYIDDENYILEKVEKAYTEDFDAKELNRTFGVHGQYKTLDVQYELLPNKKVWSRYMSSGRSMYALHCYSQDSSKAERYLNSIEIQNAEFEEYFELVDSNAFFRSKIPWEKEGSSFTKMISSDMFSLSEPELGDDYYRSVVLTPPGGIGSLSVDYFRYSRYAFNDDKEDFKDQIRKSLTLYEDLVVKKEQHDWKDDGVVSLYVLSDSLSTDEFIIYKAIDGKRGITISHAYDSTLGPSGLYNEFIKNFELLEDTMAGTGFFSSDPELYLSDILSSDSAEFKLANNNIDALYAFPEEEAFEIFKTLKDTTPMLATADDVKEYISMYNNMRYMDKSDAMLEELTEDYHANQDSALFQKEILATMVYMGTTKAMDRMRTLIMDEPPIGVHSSFSGELFSSLADSLELTAELYPEFLDLVDYEEYKDAVLKCLTMLVDSAAIDPEAYRSKLEYLTRQAKLESRRFSSTSHDFEDDINDGFGYSLRMIDFWKLLYPFKTDEKVKEVFQLAEGSKQEDIRKTYALFLSTKDEKLADSYYLELVDGEDPLKDYRFLDAVDRIDLYADTVDLRKARLTELAKNKFRNYEPDWDDSSVDSIQFISQDVDSIRTNKFDTYFIKSYRNDDEDSDWYLSVVFVQESSKAPELNIIHRSLKESTTKTNEEQFEEIKEGVISSNRRWPFNNSNYYDDYY